MPHSLYSLVFHITWHTKYNMPTLKGQVRDLVYERIPAVCSDQGFDLLSIGGVADHIHVLVRSDRWRSVPDLVRFCKGSTTFEANQHKLDLKWQKGYGVVSVNPTDFVGLIRYIENQEEHHSY